MPESFFQRVVVPVANRNDAAATTSALVPYVEDTNCTVIAVHVSEKTDGAPDKASVEQREQNAEDIFTIGNNGFDDIEVSLKTQILYGTGIVASAIDAVHDSNASAIVFTPRSRSCWRKSLTGDVTHKLVGNSEVPILVLPDREVSEA